MQLFKKLSVLLITLLAVACGINRNVVIISSEHTSTAETDSLASILRRGGSEVTIVPAGELSADILKKTGVVIYHRSDSAAIDDNEIALKELLLPYVERGGSLLLAMEGVRLMNDWGIEPQPLETEYQDASDYGFGRAVGFHGYREHPIYDGLFGGAYVWKAKTDNQARTLGFSGKNLPRAEGAKVLGINWAYIRYHEDRKLIWETPVGKGKILAVGGYLYFAEPNVNRTTLDIFTNNVANYLEGGKSPSKQKYWQYDTVQVEQTEFPAYKINMKTEGKWSPRHSEMQGSRIAESSNYWDLAGHQILVTGREKGMIDEVWIHPIMALRDLTVGVRYKDVPGVVWLNSQTPLVTKTPESFERKYTLKEGAVLSEFIVVSPDKPLMAIHYQWEDPTIESVLVTYTSNLRLMWPYSLESTGTLFYATTEDNSVTTVFDRAQELNIITAFDRKPTEMKSGAYDFRHLNAEQFDQTPAKNKQIAFLYEFPASDGELNFYLSGGESGLKQSAELINRNAGKIEEIYKSAADYYASFDKSLLSVESSDSLFNEAYRWAIISTDKFFANTPSLGQSLMAGYCSTARGWNGGHEVSGRPGYAWYFGRDAAWSCLALSSYGDFNKVKEVLRTFSKFQDPDGKVYHELTTSGSAHYDASDATPLYVMAAGDYLRKSGDIDFIREQWPHIKKAMDFCYSTDTDGDLLIENTNVGHGWQEGHQLYGAHTEVYLASLWATALKEAAYMASLMGDDTLAAQYAADGTTVENKINRNFWNDSMQFYNHGLMQDGSYQQEKCVLGGTPVALGIADPDKAVKTAGNFSSKYYSTDWGVRMVGYDSPFYAIGGYSYGNIWPFHTGYAALAEYRAGLRTQGFRHAFGSLRTFTCWDYGNIPEVIAGDELEFSGICPHQGWSSAMSMLPLTWGMLGIDSNAQTDSLSLSPAFPADWSFANVKNIYVGDKTVQMNYKREADGYEYVLTNDTEAPIHTAFTAILPLATEVESVEADGESVPFEVTNDVQNVNVSVAPFDLKGKRTITVRTKGGIAVLMNLAPVVRNMKDTNLKIEREAFDPQTGTYTLSLAGVPGESYDVSILTRSEISGAEGATLKEAHNGVSVYTVTMPKNRKEPFVNSTVTLQTAK